VVAGAGEVTGVTAVGVTVTRVRRFPEVNVIVGGLKVRKGLEGVKVT